MTITQLETLVVSWLNAVRGARELVKGRIGEAAAPSVPYLMFSVDVVQLPDSIPNRITGNTQTAAAVVGQVEIAMSFVGDLPAPHSARNDATSTLISLRHSQRTADIYAGAGLMAVGPITNLSGLETGAMRQRFDCRLTLSATLTADADAETIHSLSAGIFEHTKPFTTTIVITEP